MADTNTNKTLYKVAKELGLRPQHLYNLARNGVIKVNTVTCDQGESHKVIDQDSLDQYLARRADRQAKAEAKVEAELAADNS
jgi:hypothetical protein